MGSAALARKVSSVAGWRVATTSELASVPGGPGSSTTKTLGKTWPSSRSAASTSA